MVQPLSRTLSLLVACLLALPLAHAEEEKAPPDLGLRAQAFPAPSAERAFAVDLHVVAGGVVVGKWHLEARAEAPPGGRDEGLAWHVLETRVVGEGEDAEKTVLDAWLDATLEGLRGTLSQGAGPDPLTHAFQRRGRSFDVELQGDGREARKKEAAREGHSLLGLTSLVLLAREIGGAAGVYGARWFTPDWEYLLAERPFTSVRIEAGPGRWRGRDVQRLRMQAVDGDRQAMVVLDPETHALLYAHWQPDAGPAFDLRPFVEGGDGAASGVERDVLDVPAKTPLAAALRTTLAFITADAKRFEAVVHWGRLQELGKNIVQGTVTPEAFKKAILGQFAKNAPPPMPVDEARALVLAAKDDFKVETQGETHAVVTLPAAISPIRLTLERIDGVWYLVRLPHE